MIRARMIKHGGFPFPSNSAFLLLQAEHTYTVDYYICFICPSIFQTHINREEDRQRE